MLELAVIFLVIALIAGALGFPSVAVLSGEISKILFLIFLVLFIVMLIFGLGVFRVG